MAENEQLLDDDSYQAILRKRLLDKMNQYDRGLEFDAKTAGEGAATEGNLSRDLITGQALQKAASQIGTLNGKQANTDVTDTATKEFLGNQQRGMELGQKDAESRDKLQQYLMGKMLDQEGALSKSKTEAATKKETSTMTAQEKENDRKFKEKQAALDRENAEKIAGIKADSKEDKLPPESKALVSSLAQKNASKMSIANQMQGYLDQYRKADDDQKIVIGRQMLKVLNSPEGSDAVGSEEAKRLGSLIEYQKFNLLNPGPVFGRDLEGFDDQVVATINSVKSGVNENNRIIADAKSGKSLDMSPTAKRTRIKDTSGTATAATPDPADAKALQWAQANPDDPKAAAIMAKLKAKGVQ